MKLTKIFLNSFLIVAFFAIFGAGIFLCKPTTNEAKANDEIPIEYYAIVTYGDDIYGGIAPAYNSIIYDSTGHQIKGYSTPGEGQVLTDWQTANQFPVQPKYAANPGDPEVSAPTLYTGSEIVIQDALNVLDGYGISEKIGWFYEESYSGNEYTLTSLYKSFNGNIPANFTPPVGTTIRLYCILNPFDVVIKANESEAQNDDDAKGRFEIEGVHGTEFVYYLTMKKRFNEQSRFQIPASKNPKEWGFDGFFTANNERITDKNGDPELGWDRTNAVLYAHYVPMLNITYHYTYNNKEYTGEIQYVKADEHGTPQIYSSTEFTEDVCNGINKAINGSEEITFPTEMVVAGWFTSSSLKTQFEILQFSNQNYEVWAKIAHAQNEITFDANGGKFWDNSTTKAYTVPFGTTINDVISTKLITDSANAGAGENFASRKGFVFNKNSWTKTEDGTQSYSVVNKVEEPITIYMLWVPETYEIVYYTDGTFSEDKTVVDFGTNLYKYLDPKANNAPTRIGYNFVGWATASEDLQKSFVVESRPTTKDFTVGTINLSMIESTDTMPDHSINVHGVWIQAHTMKLSLNKGMFPSTVIGTPLDKLMADSSKTLFVFTIENRETLGDALDRMEVSDFFYNENYEPKLQNCLFQGWCYYIDGDVTNNNPGNTILITEDMLDMDTEELKANYIDITRDATIAALYAYNKAGDSTYTKAPNDTTSIIFAIVLMIVSITLLVVLILNHKNNGILEIDDKAIESYKRIYGEDAPLPTFEATHPPFETEDQIPEVKDKQNNDTE